MTVESSWRIDARWLTYTHKDEAYLLAHINDGYGVHAEGQNPLLPLVPDLRLQAIADEYDRIKARRYLHEELLEYFPELSAVLDALAEENNDA